METTKFGNVGQSSQFEALTSSELTSVAGGNSLIILIPFAVGCILGDALAGKLSNQQFLDKYLD